MPQAIGDQSYLRRQRVDGIDDKIYFATLQQSGNIFLFDKTVLCRQLQIGVYIEKPFFQYLDFGFSQCTVQSDQLSVQIALGHGVSVDNRQNSYTGSHDHFGGISPYTTHPHDKDVGILQSLYRFIAKQQPGT